MRPDGSGIWTLTGWRKCRQGFWERQSRGLTLAWGSPHRVWTVDSETCSTYGGMESLLNVAHSFAAAMESFRKTLVREANVTCKVTERVCAVESGGKWSLIPGSALDTSRVSAGVTEQVSRTGLPTAINQEKLLTEQHASWKNNRSFFRWSELPWRCKHLLLGSDFHIYPDWMAPRMAAVVLASSPHISS